MSNEVYNLFRGATLSLLHIVVGTVSDVQSVSGVLKKAKTTDQNLFLSGQSIISELDLSLIEDMSNDTKKVWSVKIPASKTIKMKNGLYAAQIKTVLNDGTVNLGDIQFIQIVEPLESN